MGNSLYWFPFRLWQGLRVGYTGRTVLLVATICGSPAILVGSRGQHGWPHAGGAQAGRECPQNRAPSKEQLALRAICKRLKVGEGAAIADIGCRVGDDSVHFARIVGPKGRVYAQEIDEGIVDRVRQRAKEEGLAQMEAVLGRTDDPRLPDASVDLIYMFRVFHHFSEITPEAPEFNDWICITQ